MISDPQQNASFFFRETVPEDDKEGLVCEVFSSVARNYDLMNDLMSGRRPSLVELSPPSTGSSSLAGTCSMWREARATLPFASRTRRVPMAEGRKIVVCDINADTPLAQGVRRAEERA